jgi:hypothetical protein
LILSETIGIIECVPLISPWYSPFITTKCHGSRPQIHKRRFFSPKKRS